jgi:hypothetical protein
VVDAQDPGGDSGLLIDNLQINPLAAPALNLGFETGDFTDWTAQGDAQIETATWGITPTEGTYQALITTGDGAVTDAQLEEQLRLAAGTLDLLGNGDVVEGSVLQLTPMTVEAGTSSRWIGTISPMSPLIARFITTLALWPSTPA